MLRDINWVGSVMQLNISQAATLIGTSEEMLKRWARQGVIPVIETDGQLLFKRKDLETWASRRRIPLKQHNRRAEPSADVAPSIFDAMKHGGFHYDVAGDGAEKLLTDLIGRLDLPGVDNQTLLDRVLEREQLSSTGMGNGIAIPHPRQPIETLDTSMVVTCFPASPVSFKALDKQPVAVVFLVLSVDTRAHLKLLSQLSYLLHQPDNASFFHSAPSKEAILKRVDAGSARFFE